MKNKRIVWVAGIAAVALGAWFTLNRGKEDAAEVEYRYEKVAKGELVRSISATGQLVALTTVDVKSKAGGKVVKLLVEEGSVVRKGQTIALIDPADTEATYQQASADLQSAQARTEQARINYELQKANSRTTVADARASLEAARTRLVRTEVETSRQPLLTKSSMANAQASYENAVENRTKTLNVTIPQARRDAEGNLRSSETSMNVAKTNLERQTELLSKGYVAQSVVDSARQSYENARANFENAQQRSRTLEQELKSLERSAQLAVEQAQAGLSQARANTTQDKVATQNLAEARNAVKQAEIALQRAVDAERNNDVRRTEVTTARASTVRSKVALDNAKVQLDSTTVVAPRDGVVTMKYLEEGTIIPPGTSTFAQGTSLVQISDTTTMYVECAVDEADIGAVRDGQTVRIVTEAFPGESFGGKVVRVNPAATTASNITAVKVRVQIGEVDEKKVRLLPGMNATCEFITLSKPDVLILPAQAVNRDGEKSTVKVKSADPMKPAVKEVTIGETGNNGVEVLAGLTEGEEVVTAEIDLKAMRETQQKMQEAMQGGGLAGGPMGGRPRPSGGGARSGGGGGARGGGTGR